LSELAVLYIRPTVVILLNVVVVGSATQPATYPQADVLQVNALAVALSLNLIRSFWKLTGVQEGAANVAACAKAVTSTQSSLSEFGVIVAASDTDCTLGVILLFVSVTVSEGSNSILSYTAFLLGAFVVSAFHQAQ